MGYNDAQVNINEDMVFLLSFHEFPTLPSSYHPQISKTSTRTQQGTRHTGLGIAPNRAFHIHRVAVARVAITNAADLLQRASNQGTQLTATDKADKGDP